MKWLDMCFKMAVSAYRVILGLIISRFETKKLPEVRNSIMVGSKFRNARHSFSFIITICFSFNNIGSFFIITFSSHIVKLFYSILLRNSTNKNDITKMTTAKHAQSPIPISVYGEVDWGNVHNKKRIS